MDWQKLFNVARIVKWCIHEENTLPKSFYETKNVGFKGIWEKQYYGNDILEDWNMFITSSSHYKHFSAL